MLKENSVERPLAVTFSEAFRFWLNLGFISFGGPAGQIAIMHQELVVGSLVEIMIPFLEQN